MNGLKNINTGFIQHQLKLVLKYTRKNSRNYTSASFCDKWNGCENKELEVISVTSSSASNCSPDACNFTEMIELNWNDNFLRNNIEEGFTVRKKKKKFTNEITIASDYLKGYLEVAN